MPRVQHALTLLPVPVDRRHHLSTRHHFGRCHHLSHGRGDVGSNCGDVDGGGGGCGHGGGHQAGESALRGGAVGDDALAGERRDVAAVGVQVERRLLVVNLRQFEKRLVYEDERNQTSEALLREARDVLHKSAQVEGHDQEKITRRPHADPESSG